MSEWTNESKGEKIIPVAKEEVYIHTGGEVEFVLFCCGLYYR